VSHDPSEINVICRFGSQESFIIINVKTVVVLNMFLETVILLIVFI